MVIAETERLLIRPLRETDILALAEMLSDPEVMRFSINGVMSREASQRFLDWCLNMYSSKGYGPWALESRDSHSFIGFAGLSPEVRNGRDEIDLGYRLAKRYWKQGFATEATARVLEHGFGSMGLDSVSCVVIPGHADSIKVAEKLGFSSYEVVSTHGMEVRIYRLTLNQWMERGEKGTLLLGRKPRLKH